MKNAKPAFARKLGAPIALLAMCSTAWSAPWTSVGSAGTVDETDLQTVVLSGAGANVASSVTLPETVVIRYNVVAVDRLLETFGNLGGASMSALFRDNGSTSRVRLKLREAENQTGILRTVLTLDSNAFPANSAFQLRDVNSCEGTPFNFDFDRKTYYVEAELQKAATEGLPSLGTIQVEPVVCVNIE